MEYLKPIIDMRIAHKEIRYMDNPIFKKVAKNLYKDYKQYQTTYQPQGFRDTSIYSVCYLRWYQGKLYLDCPYQTKEVFKDQWRDTKLYGLTWYTSLSEYKVNNIREVKDEVIAVMKLNEIDYKKSWTKQKLMKAILKHPIVEHSRVLDRFK
tara:strand:+ start:677 stop:1132 length:456 start_codon:yes stop_codon:yes gene_type:complete